MKVIRHCPSCCREVTVSGIYAGSYWYLSYFVEIWTPYLPIYCDQWCVTAMFTVAINYCRGPLRQSGRQSDEIKHVWFFRSSVRPVGPTIAPCKRPVTQRLSTDVCHMVRS